MKDYSIRFSSGDPRTFTGLSPTLLIFARIADGVTLVAPSFTEFLAGSGIYKFQYGTTQAIAFLADAATTGPGPVGRYVTGQIDPADRADEYGTSMIAIGTTLTGYGSTLIGYGSTGLGFGASNLALGVSNFALGTTLIGYGVSILAQGVTIISLAGTSASLAILIGTTTSPIGNSTTNPGDIFGYIRRVDELLQGAQTFTKGTGVLNFYDRTGATLLGAVTVVNNASLVTRA